MDEILKRRLIGAGLLLLVAFLLVSLLPEAQLRAPPEADTRVVTIELREPDPVHDEPVALFEIDRPGGIASPLPPAAADDRAEEEGGAPELDAEAQPARSAATPAPTPTPRPTATPRPAASPTPVPTPVRTPMPTSTPPAVVTPPPAAAGAERWWVQLGSFSDIGNARQAEARLRELGQPGVVAPVETASGVLYRVRAGPYTAEAQAQAAQTTIAAGGYPEARVIKP